MKPYGHIVFAGALFFAGLIPAEEWLLNNFFPDGFRWLALSLTKGQIGLLIFLSVPLVLGLPALWLADKIYGK